MAAVSKAEYLKRYLSTSADDEKKKKRKKKPKAPQKFARSVIVDDDVSWKDLEPRNEESKAKEDEFENAGDEAPVVYDEDGVQAISLDVYKKREDDQKSKWAPLKSDEGLQNQKSVVSRSPTRQTNRRHDSPDLSPSRVTRAETPDNSPPRKRNHGSTDLSPPRNKSKRTNQSPSRGGHSKYLSSQRGSSPPRKVRSGLPSNGKRSRHDSPDLIPPQRQRHDSLDISPVQRNRHDSPDQTPPRRRRHDSDLSPPRVTKDSDSDHSPPRRRRHDSSDLSPPRVAKDNDSDQSPPRRRRHNSSDLSPPRGGNDSDSDRSPPRRRQQDLPDLSSAEGKRRHKADLSPPRQRGPGSTNQVTDRKAGLLSAEDLKRENALTRKREDEMFAGMDRNNSGKDARTVHRDKTGRKRDLAAEEQKKKEEERKKAIHDEKFKEWGRGVVQTQEAQKKVEDYLHEVNKPLARYKDDEDLDSMLREQEREDDPMLAYMQKKKAVSKKKAGIKERPTYKGPPPPPNRFGIRPGYRWDGVDRSNGFENKRFAMLANKKATNMIAHKWSTEEM